MRKHRCIVAALTLLWALSFLLLLRAAEEQQAAYNLPFETVLDLSDGEAAALGNSDLSCFSDASAADFSFTFCFKEGGAYDAKNGEINTGALIADLHLSPRVVRELYPVGQSSARFTLIPAFDGIGGYTPARVARTIYLMLDTNPLLPEVSVCVAQD